MKRYFTTEEEDQSDRIKVKAIKRGNVNGRAGIFHFDPNGKDPKARRRTVPAEVAHEAKRKGLVEFVGTGGTDTTAGRDLDDRRVGAVGQRRRETSIGAGGEEERITDLLGAGNGDTRDTTAFETDPSKTARVSPGRVIRLGEPRQRDEDLDDDDGTDDEGDGDDDGTDEGTDEGATGSDPFTDTMSQEGNAGGADAPPRDDVSEHSGSDEGAGAAATDDTGTPTDQTDDGTQATAIEADPVTPAPTAPAPRARRPRG